MSGEFLHVRSRFLHQGALVLLLKARRNRSSIDPFPSSSRVRNSHVWTAAQHRLTSNADCLGLRWVDLDFGRLALYKDIREN